MHERELFRLLPGAQGAIPWIPLARLPTPIDRVQVDVPGAGLRPVPVKRDDLTGELYGGNKVRKLEFLIANALHAGATRVITAGAFGSHHALATTMYARRAGLDVTVILFPQRITPHVRDIVMMIAGLGAEVRFTRRMEFVPVALGRVRRAFGPSAFVIPPGGSDAYGTLGYVECGLELARQWHDSDTRPERIHVAAGTLGTVAGLALGLAIARGTARSRARAAAGGPGRDAVQIAATRITSPLVTNERALSRLVARTYALLRTSIKDQEIATPDVMRTITLIHDQIGEGYGRATRAGEDARARFATAGLELDATYTAKSAAAFLADPLTAQGRTLFLNTLSAAEPRDAIANTSVDALPLPIAQRLNAFND